MQSIVVIGAGLAGCEAAWQLAQAGCSVQLHEMRPHRRTPAHTTDGFAELVCSNSLKSESPNSAPWLLKSELRALGSLLLRCADQSRVPGGHALTVDREQFSGLVSERIAQHRNIHIVHGEMSRIPDNGLTIVSTGPLTSDALAADIALRTGADRLFFYDSISPIVAADSIDTSIAFRASRWNRSLDGTDDYLNCPFNKHEYDTFINALQQAAAYEPHIEEDRIPYFEACLPIEEIARRGRDTLRFGPMKPAGLPDPRTGRWPYAVVQLRAENGRADSYNLVGFQNHLRFAEQASVFRLIPGLQRADFLRYGQMHRNTYINAPALLHQTLQLRTDGRIIFAGQICGVEGYVESIATGLLAARTALAVVRDEQAFPFPRATALGSLTHYVTHADPASFQPANITFDLLPALPDKDKRRFKHDKHERHAEVCRRAVAAFEEHLRATIAPVDHEVLV